MLKSIISILLNAVYLAVLNMNIYTDRATMANGEVREWRRSPCTRLNIADQSWLYYLEIAFTVISIATSILMLLGVNLKLISKIQIISIAVSTVLFITIMIVTANSHATYA